MAWQNMPMAGKGLRAAQGTRPALCWMVSLNPVVSTSQAVTSASETSRHAARELPYLAG